MDQDRKFDTNEILKEYDDTLPVQYVLYSNLEFLFVDNDFLEHALTIFINKSDKILSKSQGDKDTFRDYIHRKLRSFLDDFRETARLGINRHLLRDAYKKVFDSESVKELKETYGIIKREGLKGLLIAIVLREKILSHVNLIKECEIPEDRIDPVFNPRVVEEDLQNFLQSCHISHTPLDTSSDEYQRLLRCQLVFKWLHANYTAQNNKELFIFVAQILEGKHDPLNRLYISGGRPCKYRKVREELFRFITGVEPRKRNSNKSRSDEKDDESETYSSSQSRLLFTVDAAEEIESSSQNSLLFSQPFTSVHRINNNFFLLLSNK